MIVTHTSGAHSSEVLAEAHRFGAYTLSLHPLQSFSNPEKSMTNLCGTIFTLEGQEQALPVATKLVYDLGGHPVTINKDQKVLYHAGACAASNYFVSVVDLAVTLLQHAGFPANVAQSALLPLIHGTLRNIEHSNPAQALTGPISRGDVPTVAKHINAILQFCPDLLQTYQQLGLYTTELAREKQSISPVQASDLRDMFDSKK
jgi:predicted short-subunit dehydrogenase-like oxidoreductase (DUF2520 family)